MTVPPREPGRRRAGRRARPTYLRDTQSASYNDFALHESLRRMAGMPVAESDRCDRDGRRERKKLATRRALGVAAMRLAVQRGLDNVLVDDIAAEAGVSARTFNNYFASKYEAICALAMERGTMIGVALRNRPAAEPLMEAITSAVLHPYVGG